MYVSIVVPMFNEESCIKNFLEEIKKLKLNYELIIVDDGSNDNSFLIAKRLLRGMKINGNVIKLKHKGKGSAIRNGIKNASGNIIVLIDIDLEYPPAKILDMVEMLGEYDLIIANRKRKDSYSRRILANIFRMMVFILFGFRCDTQSGLKAMKRDLKRLSYKADGWAWDVEFLTKAKAYGFKIGEIDVDFLPRKLGKSKINFLSPFFMLAELLKIKFSRFFQAT